MKKPPKCDICGKVFSRRDNMERHKNRHLHREMFPCDLCGQAYSQKSYLKLHKRIHSGERPFGCNICGHAFSRNDHLVIHIRGHQGLKLFKCEACGKAFSRRSYLTVHERIHTGKRPYQCHVCGCAFYRGDHLVRHRRKQHGEEPVTTVYVTTASDGSQTVYTHANSGELQPQQQLNIQVQMEGQELKCNNIIINSIGAGDNIDAEQKSAATVATAAYTDCTMCNSSCGGNQCCIDSAQQQQQQQQEQQQQVQQVQQIQQSPQHQTQQQQHHIITDCNGITKMVIGDAQIETPIQFQNCTTIDQSKQYTPVQQRAILSTSNNGSGVATGNIIANTVAAAPAATPTGSSGGGSKGSGTPGAFKCEFCNRTFSRRDNLERHKSTHADIKQFNCKDCGKSFSRKSYLTVHSRIHTGERPYKCDVCGFMFARKDHLMKHQRGKDGERKLNCIPQHQQQQQQQQQQQTIDTKDINTSDTNILAVAAQQMGQLPGEGGTMVVPVSNVPHGLTNSSSSSKTSQIYHTAIAKLGSTTPAAMPVFPSTIEISPATTQIFPTIQMYASTCLNVPQSVRTTSNSRDSTW
ncbi:zinc finger protein 436-like [Argonauta hians]